jgi:hypothetical protein
LAKKTGCPLIYHQIRDSRFFTGTISERPLSWGLRLTNTLFIGIEDRQEQKL